MRKPDQNTKPLSTSPSKGASMPSFLTNALEVIRNTPSIKQGNTSFARYSLVDANPPGGVSLLPASKVEAEIASQLVARQRANKAHRDAVLKAYRERPVRSGPRTYDANWVEGQRHLWQKNIHTAIDVLNAHKGGGTFDYNVTGGFTPEDRFMLNGRLVSKGALGNYAAGYNSVLGAGPIIGPKLTLAGGEIYEWNAYRNGEQSHRDDGYRGPRDPPQDKAYVEEGARDATEYQRRLKRQQELELINRRYPNRPRF